VAEDKVQKCAFVNTVMNIRISQQRGICWLAKQLLAM
jgi:hypothetical protein